MARLDGVTAGAVVAAFGLGVFAGHLPHVNAQSSNRVVEIRTYTAAEGQLDALATRMGTDERQFFEKHGMRSVPYSVAADPPLSENTFVYLVARELCSRRGILGRRTAGSGLPRVD